MNPGRSSFGFPVFLGSRFKPEVDFSNYDVPLYTQIVNRIKAKVAPRLGEGPLKHDHYFIIPFAYQDKGNHPEFSHSFITVIRVFATNKQPKLTPGLPTRKYKNWEFWRFAVITYGLLASSGAKRGSGRLETKNRLGYVGYLVEKKVALCLHG